LTLTLLAIGTPMLLMGDEVRRTQGGNNNAYAQDSELSWFDWNLVEKHADIRRFLKRMIAFRNNRALPLERFDITLNELLQRQPITWHGVKLYSPDWGYQSHTLAATIPLVGYPLMLHLIANAYWEALDFELPPIGRGEPGWRCCINTDLDPPHDIRDWAEAESVTQAAFRVQPRSIVVLAAQI
jgi:isoamylase